MPYQNTNTDMFLKESIMRASSPGKRVAVKPIESASMMVSKSTTACHTAQGSRINSPSRAPGGKSQMGTLLNTAFNVGEGAPRPHPVRNEDTRQASY